MDWQPTAIPNTLLTRKSDEVARREMHPGVNRSLSDAILYRHRPPEGDTGFHSTSSRDKDTPRSEIEEWLNRNDESANHPGIIEVVDAMELVDDSTHSTNTSPTSSQTDSSGRRPSGASEPQTQQRDEVPIERRVPDDLRGVGSSFGDDLKNCGQLKKRRKMKHKPLTGWFNLWLE